MNMKRKRIKYDLQAILDEFSFLKDEFELFKANCDLRQHLKHKKELSWKRVARAFLRHKEIEIRSVINPSFTFFQDRFVIGKD